METLKTKHTKGIFEIKEQSNGSILIRTKDTKYYIAEVGTGGDQLANAKLLKDSTEMLKTLIETYLHLQIKARKDVSVGIATDYIRANLRNKISEFTGIDEQQLQDAIGLFALKILTKEMTWQQAIDNFI